MAMRTKSQYFSSSGVDALFMYSAAKAFDSSSSPLYHCTKVSLSWVPVYTTQFLS